MWPSVLPLDKKWKPLLYPRPEPSLYSKPSNFWGQPSVVERSDTPQLSGTVEIDEVYLVAGHKGQSQLVKKTAELLVDDA